MQSRVPLHNPAIWDKYEKSELIGSGTYGEVWRGINKLDRNRTVALKRMKAETEKDGFPITAIREVKILTLLQHRNIVRLEEAFVDADASVYLVFEFFDHDLSGLLCLCPKNYLKEAWLKCYLRQLLEGVQYLHSHSILHRDIKTANLLIDNHGNLKIADFGLARAIMQPHDRRTSNDGGQRDRIPNYTNEVVTLWYRAPEICLGMTQYGYAVDMWAVGCIFGEMMRKKALFYGNQKTDHELLQSIWEVVGTPTRESWPHVEELALWPVLKPRRASLSKLQHMFSHPFGQEAVRLLEGLLSLDPSRRLTCQQALQHAYFRAPPVPTRPEEIPSPLFEQSCHEFTIKKRRLEGQEKAREAEAKARQVRLAREARERQGVFDNPNATNRNANANSIATSNNSNYQKRSDSNGDRGRDKGKPRGREWGSERQDRDRERDGRNGDRDRARTASLRDSDRDSLAATQSRSRDLTTKGELDEGELKRRSRDSRENDSTRLAEGTELAAPSKRPKYERLEAAAGDAEEGELNEKVEEMDMEMNTTTFCL